MKHLLATILLSLSLTTTAQQNIQFYPEMCDILQQVFCDYTKAEAETKYISSRHGQYIGQLINNKIYGWGYYLSNDDSQTFGQFRNGKHAFGITLTQEMARVGSEEHYVEYDITNGKIMRIHTVEGDQRLSYPYIDEENAKSPYGFHKITYSNGDAYYGETYNGRRHGYGVYYWTNGDFWYGKYSNGYRQGYGALFKTDHRVFYGKWIGDTKVE
ncbi:MAG: hypothetical protein IJN24_09160 [Bacteroidaceae bacterium]|nr:hypothetical protein [Bacteroidaceae bacterium]